MGDLPQALPKTVIVADHVRRHAPRVAVARQATDLLLASARADIIVPDARGVPAELVGELAAITTAMAGRRWLRANAASPPVEAFNALFTAPWPPAAPVLDQILSAVLWSWFSGPAVAGATRAASSARPAVPRGGRFGSRRHRATA